MKKSLAIAVSLCFVVLSVTDVEAGLFGRRSRCRGGSCSRYVAPSYTTVTNTTVTRAADSKETNSADANATETKAPAPVKAKSVSKQVESPSDVTAPQAAPARRAYYYYSSPCANGRCYRR